MIQDIRIRKILEALLALVREIFRGEIFRREIFKGILPAGLNETENLISKIEYALSEV